MNRKMPRAIYWLMIMAGLLAFASVPAGAQAQEGATLFRNKCMMCHGQDGTGTDVGRSLKVANLRSEEVQKQSDAQLIEVVTNGKNNMPPNKGKLTSAQIRSLVAYVRTFKSKKKS